MLPLPDRFRRPAPQLPQGEEEDRQREHEREHVADRLAYLHAQQAVCLGQDEDERDEEQSPACRRKDIRPPWHPDGLQQHVAVHGESSQGVGNELPLECLRSHADDLGIVAENGDGGFREEPSRSRTQTEESRSHGRGEPERLLHPFMVARPVAETAKRLESLSQANDDGEYHKGNPCHYRHRRYGCVAERARRHIEHDGGNAPYRLPDERGRAARHNFLYITPFEGDHAPMKADAVAPSVHDDQQEQAACLADHCRHGGPGHSPAEGEDEYRIEGYIDDRPTDHPHHGIQGIALESHLVVEHQASRHDWRPKEYDTHVSLSIGQDGGCTTQHHHNRLQQTFTDNGNDDSKEYGISHPRGSHVLCSLFVFGTKLARHEISRAMTEEESHGMNHGHDRKHHSYRRRRLRVNLSDEECVSDIVEAGDEHADDGRHRHLPDDSRNGSGREERVVVLSVLHGSRRCAVSR